MKIHGWLDIPDMKNLMVAKENTLRDFKVVISWMSFFPTH